MPDPKPAPSVPSFKEGVKAIESYNSVLLSSLLAQGLSPNETGGQGCFDLSLLGMACHHGDAACVKMLLNAGADASVVDDRDYSTLFLYAQFTQPEKFQENICLALMEAGADPLHKTGSGESAISIATEMSDSMAEKMARAWSEIERRKLSVCVAEASERSCRNGL